MVSNPKLFGSVTKENAIKVIDIVGDYDNSIRWHFYRHISPDVSQIQEIKKLVRKYVEHTFLNDNETMISVDEAGRDFFDIDDRSWKVYSPEFYSDLSGADVMKSGFSKAKAVLECNKLEKDSKTDDNIYEGPVLVLLERHEKDWQLIVYNHINNTEIREVYDDEVFEQVKKDSINIAKSLKHLLISLYHDL